MKVYIVLNSGSVDSVWAEFDDAVARDREILLAKDTIARKDLSMFANVIVRRVR